MEIGPARRVRAIGERLGGMEAPLVAYSLAKRDGAEVTVREVPMVPAAPAALGKVLCR